MEILVHRNTGKPVKMGELIKSSTGKEWSFYFGSKPGIRQGPDGPGEVHVRNSDGKGVVKGFHIDFFPDFVFVDRRD